MVVMRCKRSDQSGYSALELVVVMGIMVTISVVVLLGFGTLNDTVAVNRSARDLAVSLRRAQNMSLAVRGVTAVGGEVPPAVGIQLTKAGASYIVFADRALSRDFKYMSSSGELIEIIRFERNVIVADFLDASGSPFTPAGNVLHIIYSSPEADPRMTDGDGIGGASLAKVEIVLRSPNGKEKKVIVRESGQISVQ